MPLLSCAKSTYRRRQRRWKWQDYAPYCRQNAPTLLCLKESGSQMNRANSLWFKTLALHFEWFPVQVEFFLTSPLREEVKNHETKTDFIPKRCNKYMKVEVSQAQKIRTYLFSIVNYSSAHLKSQRKVFGHVTSRIVYDDSPLMSDDGSRTHSNRKWIIKETPTIDEDLNRFSFAIKSHYYEKNYNKFLIPKGRFLDEI